MDRPLRLIPTETTATAELARTIEALLVVAAQPLSVEDLQNACEADAEEIGDAIELLWKRFSEESSGIVLEHVAGGFAFRASAAAADACARLYDRPAEKSLSQAALETLAIIAYLGPVSRPEIARIRGVNVDGVVAGLAERGLIVEGGRDADARRAPLPHDAAVRAPVRARIARGAAADRRPRRRRERAARTARVGRREAHRLETRDTNGRDAGDALCEERRRQHRLPGRRRRAVRPRLRPGRSVERRPALGGSGAPRVLRAHRSVQSADRLRQARHRRLGPRLRDRGPRDADGRRACGDGRGGLGARCARRRLRRRAR